MRKPALRFGKRFAEPASGEAAAHLETVSPAF